MKTLALVLSVLFALPAAAQDRLTVAQEDALDALKAEMDIKSTQQAALRFFNVDPDTVGSMRSRANWKAILPRINGNFRQSNSGFDVEKTNLQVANEPVQLDNATADATELSVGATWDLPQLMFNPEVLDVSSLATLQESLLKEVTRLYYTRRRLQVDLILNPPRDPASRISKELRIQEMTATLDAMTGGAFVKRLRKGR